MGVTSTFVGDMLERCALNMNRSTSSPLTTNPEGLELVIQELETGAILAAVLIVTVGSV